MKYLALFFLLASFLASCTPAPQSATQQVVNVYASPATEPWLGEVYTCAATTSAVINITSNAPDISIRLGEPATLSTPAFQIGTDDLLVVVNRLSPLQNLTVERVRQIFGGDDPSAQAWVYAAGTDIQVLFDELIVNGRAISPFARLAVSAQQMSDTLNADVNAIGILPRRWRTGDTREIFNIPSVPVLAVTSSAPSGVIAELISCLQN